MISRLGVGVHLVTMFDMFNLDVVLAQLIDERDRINSVIAALEGVTRNGSGSKIAERRISVEGRRRIAAAQRARCAKVRGEKVVTISKRKASTTRTMSPAARRRIAAAQKTRWAKWRKQRSAA